MRRAARAIVAAACFFVFSGGASLAQPRSRVVCYTAYDSDYFYLAAVVDKPTLQSSVASPFSDPLHDDCVAVFLDASAGPDSTARSAKSVEMAVSAAGGAQLYRGAEGRPLQSFNDFLVAADGSRVPFKYGVSRRDEPVAGLRRYTVEMAIPWLELGGPPEAGRRMRFNVVAYSAASDSAPLLSMSPRVTGPQDVQNPSLWGEVAFVDAPTKTIASAPQARVCSRVMAAKPNIDGAVVDGEWNALTSFAFGGAGAEAGGASAAKPRVRITLPLKPPTPPIVPAVAQPGASLPPHVPQSWPHLTFALYHFDVQADPRKALPLKSPLNPDGTYTAVGCPLDGAGPWMTYDRVDWHRAQLEQMRLAGVDVALPVYSASIEGRAAYGHRGLTVLSGALRSLRAASRPYPMIALYLNTEALGGDQGPKPDLRTQEGRARLYSAIRDFYLEIPAMFRLSVALSEANGGGTANVVFLSSAAGFKALDANAIGYCRARYRAEFGSDLVVLGGPGFDAQSGVDAVTPVLRGGDAPVSAGPLKVATLSVLSGADGDGSHAAARVRLGTAYRTAWKRVAASGADWIVIDSWNNWWSGAAIAPSFVAGLELADITRAFSRLCAGVERSRAACIGHNLPHAVGAGATVQATLRVLNAGVTPWMPDAVSLAYRWRRKGGRDTAVQRAPLENVTPPGQVAAQTLPIAAPAQAGEYVLIVELEEKSARKARPAEGAASEMPLLAFPMQVIAAGAGPASAGSAALIGTDLPCTAEAGGAYTATVMLRNDGPAPWPRGTVVAGRLWRYVSGINATGEAEGASPVAEMADASAPTAADTAPGQFVTLRVPIVFAGADGSPLPVSSHTDAWVYLLRWEVHPPNGPASITEGEPLALTDMDPGVAIVTEQTPAQLPGEKRQPVLLTLRNSGPATWKKEGVRVGYHWYYQDGTPVVWEDETTPIPRDCVPGDEPFEMLAWITAPPYDGTYFLVWDLKIGEAWASTLPSCRAFDTRVRTVEVIGGKLAFIDLTPGYNADGVAPSDNRGDGDFDGAGHTLPVELTPPFALAATTPDTLFIASRGTGLDSSRRLSFRWGSKADKDRNMLIPAGQKVPVSTGKSGQGYSLIHILAFAVKPDASAVCTLQFVNGGEQYMQFPVSEWNGSPRFSEPLAYVMPFTYARGPGGFGPPAAVYRYTLKIGDKRKLASIQFGNSPDVRILAVTLER